MYAYLHGHLAAKSPTEVVVDCGGVGYRAEVSLRTSERLPGTGKEVHLLVHHKVQDDRERLFGFVDEEERTLFTHLIAIAGIGPAHALALLSGYDPAEIWSHIREGDSKALARTKGIGAKIAQRICVELADRARRHAAIHAPTATGQAETTVTDDAIAALLVLGYTEAQADKAVQRAASQAEPGVTLDHLVREALRNT